MRIRITVSVLFVVLAASVSLNILQGLRLRRYAYNCEQGSFRYYRDYTPVFPIEGLSQKDVQAIAEAVDNLNKESESDKEILLIRVLDRDHIEVLTGRMDNRLSGRGKVFQFLRTKEGWKLDDKRPGSWLS